LEQEDYNTWLRLARLREAYKGHSLDLKSILKPGLF